MSQGLWEFMATNSGRHWQFWSNANLPNLTPYKAKSLNLHVFFFLDVRLHIIKCEKSTLCNSPLQMESCQKQLPSTFLRRPEEAGVKLQIFAHTEHDPWNKTNVNWQQNDQYPAKNTRMSSSNRPARDSFLNIDFQLIFGPFRGHPSKVLHIKSENLQRVLSLHKFCLAKCLQNYLQL